jgi:hypothetical protein
MVNLEPITEAFIKAINKLGIPIGNVLDKRAGQTSERATPRRKRDSLPFNHNTLTISNVINL